jgi:ABC-2 type transport system permease protein
VSTPVTRSSDLDVSGTPGVPFSRLVGVELRKMSDTRAGFWLLAVIGVITVGVVLLLVFVGDRNDHTFANFLGVTVSPQGFLLPVLGVLLITGEWGQRATLTTFTLVPQRSRILLAKMAAAVLFGLAAFALAAAFSALAAAVAGAADPWGGFGVDGVARLALLQTLGVLQGLAFGVLFLNSAAAIVTYFVVPIAFSILTSAVSGLHEAQPWIDPSTAHAALFGGDPVSGEQWAHVLTTTLIWIVLPMAVGVWRVLRAEVK